MSVREWAEKDWWWPSMLILWTAMFIYWIAGGVDALDWFLVGFVACCLIATKAVLWLVMSRRMISKIYTRMRKGRQKFAEDGAALPFTKYDKIELNKEVGQKFGQTRWLVLLIPMFGWALILEEYFHWLIAEPSESGWIANLRKSTVLSVVDQAQQDWDAPEVMIPEQGRLSTAEAASKSEAVTEG